MTRTKRQRSVEGSLKRARPAERNFLSIFTCANGLPTFQEVGAALDEIHSHELYKPQCKSFKTYLQSILILRLTQSQSHEIVREFPAS
jgi:hypothetical protein